MKKLIKTIITFLIILGTITNTFAATYIDNTQNETQSKNPTGFSYKDIMKLEEIATIANEKQVKVVNATKYNNDDAVWIVRLKFGTDESTEYADFLLTTLPYIKDMNTNKVSLPFNTIAEGCGLYGPKWYYYGILDDKNHDICGYIVAQRIKRWSKWSDLEYTGIAKNGTIYAGFYNEECNDEFLRLHVEILG